MLEEKVNRVFGDEEPKEFGTGWWSGVLSAFFGFLSFGAVLCLHYPQLLTAPELRPRYPMHVMRILIQGLIVGAIIFGGRLLTLAQEEGPRPQRDGAGVRGDPARRRERADQPDPARRSGDRPRLVPARPADDGPHLRADRAPLAAVSRPEHVPPGMDAGRRVLSVDASSGADPVAHDPVARHRGESTSSAIRRCKASWADCRGWFNSPSRS